MWTACYRNKNVQRPQVMADHMTTDHVEWGAVMSVLAAPALITASVSLIPASLSLHGCLSESEILFHQRWSEWQNIIFCISKFSWEKILFNSWKCSCINLRLSFAEKGKYFISFRSLREILPFENQERNWKELEKNFADSKILCLSMFANKIKTMLKVWKEDATWIQFELNSSSRQVVSAEQINETFN